jgi:ABC-type multidrug transport system ATPase subunit
MNRGQIAAVGTTEEIIEEYGSGERLQIRGSPALANYIKANTELQVDYDSSKGEIRVQLRQKIDALAALAAAEQSGMDWGAIQTGQDSLEEVFVKLVSASVNEQGEITVMENRTNHGRF